MASKKSLEQETTTALPTHRSEPIPGKFYEGTALELIETFLKLAEKNKGSSEEHSYLQAADHYQRIVNGYSAQLKKICNYRPSKAAIATSMRLH